MYNVYIYIYLFILTSRAGGWLDLDDNREQEFFKRQLKKEEAVFGAGRGHRYNTNREKRAVLARVSLRREARLMREEEERKTKGAAGGRGKKDTGVEASDASVCSIS